jgi:SAM-dependent methyltransferase
MNSSSTNHQPASACPACGATERRRLGEKNACALWHCAHCGVIFVNAWVDDGALTELYDHYYDEARFETPAATILAYERLARTGARFRQSGRWLDIGYGEGGLLAVAEAHGWSCYGAEVAPPALAYGARHGWIVSAEAESDQRFPPQGFDVVTMIEFLEHTTEPGRWLAAAARWLRPGGLLYLTTPNAESLNYHWLGVSWSVVKPPEHLTLWTARGLRAALVQTGFAPQRMRTEGFNPCEIIARWRSRAQPTAPPPGRNQTAFALNQTFTRTPWRRAVKAGLNQCLSALRIGDGLKVWAVRERDSASFRPSPTSVEEVCIPRSQ